GGVGAGKRGRTALERQIRSRFAGARARLVAVRAVLAEHGQALAGERARRRGERLRIRAGREPREEREERRARFIGADGAAARELRGAVAGRVREVERGDTPTRRIVAPDRIGQWADQVEQVAASGRAAADLLECGSGGSGLLDRGSGGAGLLDREAGDAGQDR